MVITILILKEVASALQSIKSELEDHTHQMRSFKKIGMTLMTSVGGASGPLFASFFLSVSKTFQSESNLQKFSQGLCIRCRVNYAKGKI